MGKLITALLTTHAGQIKLRFPTTIITVLREREYWKENFN